MQNPPYTSTVNRVQQWWWVTFLPIYVFWFIPIPYLMGDTDLPNMWIAIIWMLVGLVLEWFAHPNLRFSDIKRLPTALIKHPIVLLALLFAGWTLLVSLFSRYPGLSFTGTLHDSSDGALWTCVQMIILVLVYLQSIRDNSLPIRLGWAFVAVTGLLVCFAFAEYILGQGIFLVGMNPVALPVVTFLGRGHLMGTIAFGVGTALALWFHGKKWLGIPIFITSILLGIASHRAPWLSLLLVIPFCWWKTKNLVTTFLAVLAIGVGVFVGIQVLQTSGVTVRAVESGTTLSTRSILWKAAIGGIQAKPFGWGGAHFNHFFYQFLSEKEIKESLKLELGMTFIKVIGVGELNPLFTVMTADKKTTSIGILLWKAHNQVLDIGLMWGIPGLLIYIAIFFHALRGLGVLNPLSVGVLVYAIFLLTWFIPPNIEALVMVVLGAASAKPDIKVDFT